MNKTLRASLIAAILGACVLASQAQAATYTLTDLGSLNVGGTAVATAINASGQVTGYSAASNGFAHAFRYTAGVMVDLGTLEVNGESRGFAINATGQVTGQASSGIQQHAFISTNGGLLDMGVLGTGNSNSGNAISASGVVAGTSNIAVHGDRRAWVSNGALLLPIGTLGGSESDARGMDAAGNVVGSAKTSTGESHAFYYDGSMHDLGTLGGDSSANGISNGYITGISYNAASTSSQAFLYYGAVMHPLGTLAGGNYSSGLGVNAAGDVVGESVTSSPGDYRAILFTGGTLYDLNALIDPSDPLAGNLQLLSASGINDAGQIIAQGSNGHSYLLNVNVVPLPAGLWLLLSGVGVIAGAARKQRSQRA